MRPVACGVPAGVMRASAAGMQASCEEALFLRHVILSLTYPSPVLRPSRARTRPGKLQDPAGNPVDLLVPEALVQVCDYLNADVSEYAALFWLTNGGAACARLAGLPQHLQLAIFAERPGRCARSTLASALHTLPIASQSAAVAAAARGGTLALAASDRHALATLAPMLAAVPELRALRTLELVDAGARSADALAGLLTAASVHCGALSRLSLSGGLTEDAVAPVSTCKWPALARLDLDLQDAIDSPRVLLGWNAPLANPAAAPPARLEHISIRSASPGRCAASLMAQLRAASRLTALELADCELNANGAQWPVALTVRRLPALRRLALVNCGFSDVGAGEVLDATRSCTGLVSIDFTRTPGLCKALDPRAGLKILAGGARALQALTQLRAVAFGFCALPPATAIALVRVLPEDTTRLQMGIWAGARAGSGSGSESDLADEPDGSGGGVAPAGTRRRGRGASSEQFLHELTRFGDLRALALDGLLLDADLAAPLAGALHAATQLTHLDIDACVIAGDLTCSHISLAVAEGALRGALRSVALPDPIGIAGEWHDPAGIVDAMTLRAREWSEPGWSEPASVAVLAASSAAAVSGMRDVDEVCDLVRGHELGPDDSAAGGAVERAVPSWSEPASIRVLARLRSVTSLALTLQATAAFGSIVLDQLSALGCLRRLSVTAYSAGATAVVIPACTALQAVTVLGSAASVAGSARGALAGVTRLSLGGGGARMEGACDTLAALPSTARLVLTASAAIATPAARGLAALTCLTSLELVLECGRPPKRPRCPSELPAAALAALTRLVSLKVDWHADACCCAGSARLGGTQCECASGVLSSIGAMNALTSIVLSGFAGASAQALADALGVSAGGGGRLALRRLMMHGREGPWACAQSAGDCLAVIRRAAEAVAAGQRGIVHVGIEGDPSRTPVQTEAAALAVVAWTLGVRGVETVHAAGWRLELIDAKRMVKQAACTGSLREMTLSRMGWSVDRVEAVRACAPAVTVHVVDADAGGVGNAGAESENWHECL